MLEGKILCKECARQGHTPQWLGTAEGLSGHGVLKLWCKKCRKEISIRIDDD